MTLRLATPKARSVLTYATAFVIGGSLIIAGVLSHWTNSGGLGVTTGLDYREGQIILSLGILGALLGVVAACNTAVWIEVFIAAAGCTTTSAVLSIALRRVHDLPAPIGNNAIHGVGSLAEGLWIVVAGGAVLGLASIMCLSRALYRLSREERAIAEPS